MGNKFYFWLSHLLRADSVETLALNRYLTCLVWIYCQIILIVMLVLRYVVAHLRRQLSQLRFVPLVGYWFEKAPDIDSFTPIFQAFFHQSLQLYPLCLAVFANLTEQLEDFRALSFSFLIFNYEFLNLYYHFTFWFYVFWLPLF